MTYKHKRYKSILSPTLNERKNITGNDGSNNNDNNNDKKWYQNII